MTTSTETITSRRPTGDGWTFMGFLRPPPVYELVTAWSHRTGINVVSSVPRTEAGPEWHISVTFRGGRASREQVRAALAAFDMRDAEEDNHVPHGKARNFWLPVNRDARGKHCKCKDESPLFTEGEYQWTDPRK